MPDGIMRSEKRENELKGCISVEGERDIDRMREIERDRE